MTAIVQPLPRNGWSNSQTDLNMSADDVSRMFVPRKSAQRSNSSSSLASAASSASSTSTISATTTTTTTAPATSATTSNQPNGLTNGDTTTSWAAASRKKPARGIWPASSKAEPVAGLSTARSQSVPANASGPSAASAISALHVPSHSSSSQSSHQPPPPPTQQQNGLTIRNTAQNEPVAQLHLQPLNGTFERKIIKVPRTPDMVRIGRQTNNKTLPTPENGYFDSKVLSRQHAEVWAESSGIIFIRDVKSSNGTFVNGKRLSPENRDSEPHALTEADVLELGIDIVSEDQKTVVHHKVAARVDHAGYISSASDLSEFSDADIGLPNGVVTPHTFSQNTRSRPTSSQGANNSNNRFNSAGASTSNGPGATQQSKWLQPVTMEQIVKRLNNELKQARVQSSNIRDNSSYVDALNAGEKPQPPRRSFMSPIKSWVQPRIESIPPTAPQPSPPQPLLEASAAGNAKDKSTEPVLQPILRRSDTEKPSSAAASSSSSPPPLSGAAASSPTKSEQSSQILKLLEALGNAQKEIASQSERLTEMEAALNKEREERKIAEERAGKLESGALSDVSDESSSSPQQPSVPSGPQSNGGQHPPDIDPSALQQRIELLCAEMDQMKTHMERYRQRAENAEHESQRDRRSLAEMVESIKKREDAAKRRSEKKRKSRKSDGKLSEQSSTIDEEDREIEQLDEELGKEAERATHRLLAISFSKDDMKHAPNGTSTSNSNMSITELQQLGKAAIAAATDPNSRNKEIIDDGTIGQLAADPQEKRRSTRQEQLAQTAPYASMLGVILLGMGLMAYLNGWQKAVER